MAVVKLTTLRPKVAALDTRRTPTLGTSGWRTSNMTAAQRGYDSVWRQRREQQLRENPLCCYCQQEGRVTAATVADHITPHRGDPELFNGPLQSLCATCHSGRKAREEAQAGLRG